MLKIMVVAVMAFFLIGMVSMVATSDSEAADENPVDQTEAMEAPYQQDDGYPLDTVGAEDRDAFNIDDLRTGKDSGGETLFDESSSNAERVDAGEEGYAEEWMPEEYMEIEMVSDETM